MAANEKFVQLAREAALRHGVPPELFMGLVQQESGFNPKAVSSAKAVGLAQLMPGTARDLGLRVDADVDDRLDPAKNLDAGARYLSQMLKKFGSERAALSAYNWGPGNMQKYLEGKIKAMPKETRDYAPAVIGHSTRFGGDTRLAENTAAPKPAPGASPAAQTKPGANPAAQTKPGATPTARPTAPLLASADPLAPPQRAAVPYTAANGVQGLLMADSAEEQDLMSSIAQQGYSPERETQLTRAIAQLLPARDMLAGQNVMGGSDLPNDLDHLFNDIIEAA